MAYIGQDKKKAIAAKLKPVLKQYGIKGTLSIDNYSTIVLKIKEGALDFIENFRTTIADHPTNLYKSYRVTDHIDVNPYWYHEHFNGACKEFLEKALNILNEGNHDNSNSQIDYFDVGWYVNVRIGSWDKPYILEK